MTQCWENISLHFDGPQLLVFGLLYLRSWGSNFHRNFSNCQPSRMGFNPRRFECSGGLLCNPCLTINILSFIITLIALTYLCVCVWCPSRTYAFNFCHMYIRAHLVWLVLVSCDVDRVNRGTSLMKAIPLFLKKKLVRLTQFLTYIANGIWKMEWFWLHAASMML